MGAAITLRSDYETVRERFSALRMIAQNRDNPLILLVSDVSAPGTY